MEPESVRRSAEESFGCGLRCAESVVLALARAQGVDPDLPVKMATAFCSGMSRTRGTCGALTGAIMGMGLAYGRSDAATSLEPSYQATQRLVREFEQEFGARDCRDLLGCDISTMQGQAVFKLKNLGVKCTEYTGRAAEIAAKIIAER